MSGSSGSGSAEVHLDGGDARRRSMFRSRKWIGAAVSLLPVFIIAALLIWGGRKTPVSAPGAVGVVEASPVPVTPWPNEATVTALLQELGVWDKILMPTQRATVIADLHWAARCGYSRDETAFLVALAWEKSKLDFRAYEPKFGTFNQWQYTPEVFWQRAKQLEAKAQKGPLNPLDLYDGLEVARVHYEWLRDEAEQQRGPTRSTEAFSEKVYVLWNRWVERRNDGLVNAKKSNPKSKRAEQDLELGGAHAQEYREKVLPVQRTVLKYLPQPWPPPGALRGP